MSNSSERPPTPRQRRRKLRLRGAAAKPRKLAPWTFGRVLCAIAILILALLGVAVVASASCL